MRSPLLPEVPSSAKAGLAALRIAARCDLPEAAHLPATLLERLDRKIKAILAMPDVQDALATTLRPATRRHSDGTAPSHSYGSEALASAGQGRRPAYGVATGQIAPRSVSARCDQASTWRNSSVPGRCDGRSTRKIYKVRSSNACHRGAPTARVPPYRMSDQYFSSRLKDTGKGVFNCCAQSDTRNSSSIQRNSSRRGSWMPRTRSSSSRAR